MKQVLITLVLMLSAATAGAADDLSERYRVSSGDSLRVSVYGHADLSGEFEVDGAGQLSLPLIQDVEAEGKTLNELEQIITDKLKPDYLLNPRVAVEILNYRPFYIVGEVNDPGSYAYVSGMTVINAVALAGGFTYRANKREVKITRDQSGDKDDFSGKTDTTVLPGDVIEIGERFF
jgi:protein involved in polysaccharide export with SLBB domain